MSAHTAPDRNTACMMDRCRARAGIGIALLAGLVFGAGLILSGMTDPTVVLGFLDVAGEWNPSLAFVMGGAVGVTLVGFRLVARRRAPLCDVQFHLPQKQTLDARLLVGAAMFGVGWGLSGYCPGPALTGLLAGNPEAGIVAAAMLAGAWLQRRTNRG